MKCKLNRALIVPLFTRPVVLLGANSDSLRDNHCGDVFVVGRGLD